MRPLVEGVLEARPDRVVWGTDGPHVNQYDSIPLAQVVMGSRISLSNHLKPRKKGHMPQILLL